MKKIVVTGGSGGAGSYVIKHLLDHDYEILNLDQIPPPEQDTPFIQTNLMDYSSVFTGMYGYDAVVHCAANPEPDFDHVTGADRFKNNTLAAYNTFNAAVALGMQRIVWASSETVLGFPFDNTKPDSVPVDETQIQKPQNSYALSKVVCEELARQMNRLYDIPIIGLEFSNILYTDSSHRDNYDAVPAYWSDPLSRKFNLWGYIDARDVALSVRLGLESPIMTADNFIIAAADTIMNRPSRELMQMVFPDVPVDENMGEFESLLSTEKARKLLGFEPQYSWRDYLQA